MNVNLDTLEGLPERFLTRLAEYDELFSGWNSNESWVNIDPIKELIIEINTWCMKNQVIGYHFTRAIESEILHKGLLSRHGNEIREDFIKKHFHCFTEEEQIIILQRWKQDFGKKGDKKRDCLVYFSFTLRSGGNYDLNAYYGGEQVYSSLRELPEIQKKLSKIGAPLLLKCALEPKNISTFDAHPWGKIAVSTYNLMKNPNACQFDQDGEQTTAVPPENIEIIKLKRQRNKFIIPILETLNSKL